MAPVARRGRGRESREQRRRSSAASTPSPRAGSKRTPSAPGRGLGGKSPDILLGAFDQARQPADAAGRYASWMLDEPAIRAAHPPVRSTRPAGSRTGVALAAATGSAVPEMSPIRPGRRMSAATHAACSSPVPTTTGQAGTPQAAAHLGPEGPGDVRRRGGSRPGRPGRSRTPRTARRTSRRSRRPSGGGTRRWPGLTVRWPVRWATTTDAGRRYPSGRPPRSSRSQPIFGAPCDGSAFAPLTAGSARPRRSVPRGGPPHRRGRPGPAVHPDRGRPERAVGAVDRDDPVDLGGDPEGSHLGRGDARLIEDVGDDVAEGGQPVRRVLLGPAGGRMPRAVRAGRSGDRRALVVEEERLRRLGSDVAADDEDGGPPRGRATIKSSYDSS